MSYRLNHNAIRRVAEREFGILGPIIIKRRRRRVMGRDNARAVLWIVQSDGEEYVKHVLYVNGERDPARVSESIAHELKHMADAERVMRSTHLEDPAPAIRKYLLQPGVPYRQRTSEVHARIAGVTYGPVIEEECIR